MFFSTTYSGNLHETATAINKQGLSKYTHSFHNLTHGTATIVIFKFDKYATYCNFCVQTKRKPTTLEQYLDGELYAKD